MNKNASALNNVDFIGESHLYSEILLYIEKFRSVMFTNNPLSLTLKNEDIPFQQRLKFVPYLLFPVLGFADVVNFTMRIDKPEVQLTLLEKKINNYVEEDNFHYNFYLQDLETLGYNFEKFGSTSAVIRHVFSGEAVASRKFIYSMAHYSRHEIDPLIRLALCETIEAGIVDLMTAVYKNFVKNPKIALPELHYFGDTHVKLEQNHTVTEQWSTENYTDEKSNQIKMSGSQYIFIRGMVDEIMGLFNDMFSEFNTIVLSDDAISPEKYIVGGAPAIGG